MVSIKSISFTYRDIVLLYFYFLYHQVTQMMVNIYYEKSAILIEIRTLRITILIYSQLALLYYLAHVQCTPNLIAIGSPS